MPHLPRRASVCVALLALLLTLPAAGQPTPPAKPTAMPGEKSKDVTPFSSGLNLPVEAEVPQKLEAVHDYIKAKEWEKATQVLQAILDAREDVLLASRSQTPEGKTAVVWGSLRKEARGLLATLPPEGLQYYEVAYGAQARNLLREARTRNDPELLAAVAERYLCTEAGIEAVSQLADFHLDRGRPLLAAMYFERLLTHPAAGKLPLVTHFKAALALARSGDKEAAELVWKRLADKAPDGLVLGGKGVSLEQLRKELNRAAAAAEVPQPADWPIYRGSPMRSGRAADGTPDLRARWEVPTLSESVTRAWLRVATGMQEARRAPVLPGSFPIVTGDRVIYRSQRGVEAVRLKTGALDWVAPSDWSLDALAADPSHLPHLDSWITSYLQAPGTDYPQVLWENSVLGMLGTDGNLVYAVEDIPIPPYPSNYPAFIARAGLGLHFAFAPFLTNSLYHSRLLAIDIGSGKVVWEQGGRKDAEAAARAEVLGETTAAAPPLFNSFFLGPPLPLGGKLYLLAEKDQDVRLLCLDAAGGDVVWSQLLAVAKNRMLLDGGRRMQAAALAYGDGVLVCPTNAGGIFAVDLLSHGLLWAQVYREQPPPPKMTDQPPFPRGRNPVRPVWPTSPPNISTDWQVTAPIISQGRVVFAAPDEGSLHCLSLRDGTPLWKAAHSDGDQYLAAVTGDRVLVVGQAECRILDLADGRVLARLETGLPSGQGVLGDGVYYLPLKERPDNKAPAVCVIDVDRGVIRELITAPPNVTPGNLVFHDGQVLSQTATAVTAFPLAPAQKDPPK
jgi:outer membrane protein assembly factor BamB